MKKVYGIKIFRLQDGISHVCIFHVYEKSASLGNNISKPHTTLDDVLGNG